MGQPTRPTQPSIPLSSLNAIAWITGEETVKRQTGLRMAAWLQVEVRGLELRLRPIGCTPALYVTQKRRCSSGVRLVALRKCYMLLPQW